MTVRNEGHDRHGQDFRRRALAARARRLRDAARRRSDRGGRARPEALGPGGPDRSVPVRNRSRRRTLTFEGRRYPFTLLGELNGLGALSGIEGAGAVYNLADVSKFAGAYIQGGPPVSVGSLPGEIWLRNTNGVIIRLSGLQTELRSARAVTRSSCGSAADAQACRGGVAVRRSSPNRHQACIVGRLVSTERSGTGAPMDMNVSETAMA